MADDVFGIVGTTVAGNFHVERVVAEGGFGVVYRALHGGFRAPVAIKVLKVPSTMTPDQRKSFLAKFSEEAELLFRLSAMIPEVVRPLHVDVIQQADGNVAPFLALEWLEGEPFDQILARRRAANQPMALHKLVKTLRPIAHALARAHHFQGPEGAISIIHRDLKPENIFLSVVNGVEKVKILDFGIARTKSVATQMAGRVTAGEGLNAFTPAYGAPEQWVPKRFGQTGPWTDVWGLAITMVEALCGHSPIDGEVPAMMGTALDEHRRPTPRNEGVSVSDDIERVFERALAVDPRSRTKDVETFWSELEAALGMSSSFVARDARRDPTTPMPSDPPGVMTQPGGHAAPGAVQVRPPSPAPAAPMPGSGIPSLDLGRPQQPPPASARSLGGAPTLDAATQRSADPAAPRVPTLMPDRRMAASSEPSPRMGSSPALAPPSSPRVGSSPGFAPPSSSRVGSSPGFAPPSSPMRAGSSPALPVPGALDPFEDVEPFAAELDLGRNNPAFGGGLRPAVRPVQLEVGPAPRGRAPSPPPMRRGPEPAPDTTGDMADLRARLRGPLVLVGIAVVIALADVFVANTQGELLRIEGVRPLWIAAPLAVAGVAVAFWRLLGDRDA